MFNRNSKEFPLRRGNISDKFQISRLATLIWARKIALEARTIKRAMDSAVIFYCYCSRLSSGIMKLFCGDALDFEMRAAQQRSRTDEGASREVFLEVSFVPSVEFVVQR